jgi:hypothetical protein
MIIEKDDEVTILKCSFYTGDFRKLYITKIHNKKTLIQLKATNNYD